MLSLSAAATCQLRIIDTHVPRAPLAELRYRPSSMSKETSGVPREPQPAELGSTSTEPFLSAPVSNAAPELRTCDVCDELLPADEDDDESDGGHGLYVWVRHGVVVYEEPPLCAACATAITITAFQRWSVEEEEG